MIYKPTRTKLYRQFVTPAGYRQPEYRPTSKAIPAIMNAELTEMQSARKQKKG